MEITTDIQLKGAEWAETIEELSKIFTTKTNYQIFLLALSIGVMHDKRKESISGSVEDIKYVPRNVLHSSDEGRLDTIFQAAILTTSTEDLDEKTRLEYAFGDKCKINKINFLTEFANYGVGQLKQLIGISNIDTIDKIRQFANDAIASSSD